MEVRSSLEPPERRLGMLTLTPERLVELFRGAWEVTENPVPEDARVVRAFYQPERDRFVLVLEHDSFLLTHPGSPIVELTPPTYQRLDEEDEETEAMAARVQAALAPLVEGMRRMLTPPPMPLLNGRPPWMPGPPDALVKPEDIDVHQCDGCRQYRPCTAQEHPHLGSRWLCEDCG